MPPGYRIPATRLYARALRRRCPACGGRPLFVTWFRMVPNCPVCGLELERGEQGYWLGAYFFNLMAMEAAFVIFLGPALYLTWPDPPWGVLQYLALALMVVVPVGFFPWSKTLFLAFDLMVRPPEPEEFEAPREAALNRPQRPRGADPGERAGG